MRISALPMVPAVLSGFVFVLAPPSARAQETVVRGIVLGPDSAPLAIERVVLHRVDAAGGATVAEAASGVDGRFVLTAPASSDTAGVYFVAARHEGELYIGAPFRLSLEGAPEQVLQVGVPGTSASALLANAESGPLPLVGERSNGGRSTPLFIVPLLIAGAALLYVVVPRRRVEPARALLIRIAEIDERLPDAPQGQRETLRAERTRLVERLRAG